MEISSCDLVLAARRVAVRAHQGQTDKGGAPYIGHPARVARLVSMATTSQSAIAAAWLHDVVEDTDVTLDALSAAGFPAEVVDAVEALTHRKGETRVAYIERVRGNLLAVQVKRCDIQDNLDHNRLAALPDLDRERLESKYAKDSRNLLGPWVDSA